MKRCFSKALAIVLLTSINCCFSAMAQVPESDRSREVQRRISTKLKADLQKQELKLGSPIFLRIFKQPSILEVWIQKEKNYRLFRTYPILAFSGTPGPKLREGDYQAPEGCYFVTSSRMNPFSQFHLSFNLGYPNAYDRFHRRTGSLLMVHGNQVSVGCYAMGDAPIEEIWTLAAAALKGGQNFFRVHCFPFPLTKEKLAAQSQNRWHPFWKTLQPIYNAFEKTKIPPTIIVKKGKYTIR